jgi:hypothetical protein
MEHEKKYSAKEAALAVLKKAEEVLKKSELLKAEIKSGPANSVESQPAPNKNPAEIAENGNPAPGALPQNTDTYGAEMKGHIKLAKFIGRMEAKRGKKAE